MVKRSNYSEEVKQIRQKYKTEIEKLNEQMGEALHNEVVFGFKLMFVIAGIILLGLLIFLNQRDVL